MRKGNWAFCAPLTKIVTSQFKDLRLFNIFIPCNSDISLRNQVKFGTLMIQHEKKRKDKFFVAMATCSVPNPFCIIFEIFLLLSN